MGVFLYCLSYTREFHRYIKYIRYGTQCIKLRQFRNVNTIIILGKHEMKVYKPVSDEVDKAIRVFKRPQSKDRTQYLNDFPNDTVSICSHWLACIWCCV